MHSITVHIIRSYSRRWEMCSGLFKRRIRVYCLLLSTCIETTALNNENIAFIYFYIIYIITIAVKCKYHRQFVQRFRERTKRPLFSKKVLTISLSADLLKLSPCLDISLYITMGCSRAFSAKILKC